MLFRRSLCATSLLVLALAPPALAAQDGEPDPTEQLFAKKCASCHSIGEGPRVGPDLKDVHLKRDRAWLSRIIQVPSQMLSTDAEARKLLSEYKGVRMPDLGLTDQQTTAMVDLLERCSSEPCNLAGAFTPVTEATPLDVELGRQLYVGLEPFKNGGPTCLSCHAVQGMGGIVAGGTLARDLTHSFARLGDEGLGASLVSPPFPVMNKIFERHPLEEDEAFAIRAFLYEANRAQPEDDDHWSLAFLGVLGALTVLILLNALWRRRLRGVRLPLTRNAIREV